MAAWTFPDIGSFTHQRIDWFKRSELWRRCLFFRHFAFFPSEGRPGEWTLAAPLQKQALTFVKAFRYYRMGTKQALCPWAMKKLVGDGRRAWNKFLAMHELARAFYPREVDADPFSYFPPKFSRAELLGRCGAPKNWKAKQWHPVPKTTTDNRQKR